MSLAASDENVRSVTVQYRTFVLIVKLPIPFQRYHAPMPQLPPPGLKPTVRMASRVILLDERDRILLFRWEDERLDTKSIWITPGGGVERGESPEAAARRELIEETGIDAEPGACVWRRSHTFRFGDAWIEQRELFYLVRRMRIEVRLDGLEPHERVAMTEHRLWAADAIAASSDWFAPRELASLLRPLLRGELPSQPIEIGA